MIKTQNCHYFALLITLLTASCGRIGFAPLATDSDPIDDGSIPSGALYISPMGSDSADGSLEDPFLSFSLALSKLSAGSTLIALPGTYSVSSGTGTMNIDCRPQSVACDGAPCANGSANSPIVVRALDQRRARIVAEAGSSSEPIGIRSCQHYEIEGFMASNIDDASVQKATTLLHDSTDIVFRHNLLRRSNRMLNGHLLEITTSSDILLEDNELYDYHRYAIISYRSASVTARRNYANARGYTDLTDGYTSSYPTSGDASFVCSHSADCRFENNISEGGSNFGILLYSTLLDNDLPNSGDGAQYLGNFIVGANYGVFISSGWDTCPDQLVVSNPVLRNNVVLNSSERNLALRGARGVVLDHNSSLGSDARIDVSPENAALTGASVAISNTLAVSPSGNGLQVAQQADWSIDYSNSFGPPDEFNTAGDVSGLGDNNSTLNAELAGCVHRIPQSSPMSGAGSDGSDIGANIIYRYQDCQLTNTLLWDADTGAFPCGAVVPGINDVGDVCSSVHKRLGIGDACAVQ